MLAAPTPTTSGGTPGGGYTHYRDPERGLGSTPTGTPTPSPEQLAQQQGMNDALAWFQGFHGPSLALNNQQSGQLAGQLGMIQVGYGQSVNALNRGAGNDLARINLGPQYDQVERDAIARQLAGLSDVDRIRFQMLGNDFGQLDIAKREAWQRAGQAQTATRSDATARGSVGSRNYKERWSDIQHQLANQLEGIGFQRENTRLGALEGQLGRKEQAAKLEDRNKVLDIKAKEYGLDRAKVQNNLQQGLARLGLDQVMDVNAVLDAMNSNDLELMAIGQQIFRDALQFSDFFTTLPTALGGVPGAPYASGGQGGGGGGGGGGSW